MNQKMVNHNHEPASGGSDGVSRVVAGLAIVLFAALFCLSLFQLYQQSQTHVNKVLASDVALLGQIFTKIHTQCGIVGFEHERNFIDFLTVGTFSGSQIGSMNVLRARAWQGPYLKQIPTLQEKQYEIVRAKTGYYIVPGHGVRLAGGAVMGKDIVVTPQTDIEAMLRPGGILTSDNHQLAYKVPMGVSDVGALLSLVRE